MLKFFANDAENDDYIENTEKWQYRQNQAKLHKKTKNAGKVKSVENAVTVENEKIGETDRIRKNTLRSLINVEGQINVETSTFSENMQQKFGIH